MRRREAQENAGEGSRQCIVQGLEATGWVCLSHKKEEATED